MSFGDNVELSLCGWCDGKVVPFSVRSKTVMTLRPHPDVPGLFEQVAHKVVGWSGQIAVTFPPDYPVATLREKSASFSVQIHGATEFATVRTLSPDLMKYLGLGNTQLEVSQNLARILFDEKTKKLRLETHSSVLSQVAGRSSFVVPEALLDQEIKASWEHLELPSLRAMGISPELQQGDLRLWLSVSRIRHDVAQRIKIALVLRAIIHRDHLHLDAKDLRNVVLDVARQEGRTEPEIFASLKKNHSAQYLVLDRAWQQLALAHVLRHVKLIQADETTSVVSWDSTDGFRTYLPGKPSSQR